MPSAVTVSVAPADADINGATNCALQAAVDYVAALGGGRVDIGPGTYTMRDSLHLRNKVQVVGTGADTVLIKAPAARSALVLDGDYGEEQVTLAESNGFEVGDGITVFDDSSGGFHTVVGTVLWRDGHTFGVSKPMNGDYLVSRNARAATTFPVVSGYYVEGASVEGLTIEGRKGDNPLLNGCRGAGVFLYRSHGTVIQSCTINDFHGDGISFQQSNGVTVIDCVCSGNTHLGLHPGSGSGSPVIRDCTSEENGRIGLFLCWRVKHGIFEDNVLRDNGETGISIGHKDTDNVFRRNTVEGNNNEGILFRNESEPMAGHRNLFENNTILNNGSDERGCGVRVRGVTRDLTFRENTIRNEPGGDQRIAIFIESGAADVTSQNNTIEGHPDGDIVREQRKDVAPASA